MAYTSHVTSKGQFVILAVVRRRFGIKPCTHVVVRDEGEQVVLVPLADVHSRRGMLRGDGAMKVFCPAVS